MRIIKEDYESEISRKARPAVFAVFPEEWVTTPPQFGAEEEEPVAPESGNGKDTYSAPVMPQIDLEAVRREADHIVERARQESARIIAEANAQAEQVHAQVAQDAQHILAQATADGDVAKKEAYAAGFSAGEDNGFKKGFEDGYVRGKGQAIDEASRSLAMLNKTAQGLENYRAQILHEAQQDIVKMAITVAEKVLHKEIMSDPRTVISVVKNAISKVGFKRNFTIVVNPLDIEVLQSASEEVMSMVDNLESIKFKADPKVEAGGCMVLTESGTVDAQVDRQFNEIKTSVMNAMSAQEQ